MSRGPKEGQQVTVLTRYGYSERCVYLEGKLWPIDEHGKRTGNYRIKWNEVITWDPVGEK